MELSSLIEIMQLHLQPVPPTSCHYVGSSGCKYDEQTQVTLRKIRTRHGTGDWSDLIEAPTDKALWEEFISKMFHFQRLNK